MAELAFLVHAIADLFLGAFLLRWLFAVLRADFRNPLVQSLHRLTNPVILPLRRLLPAIGRTDTATVAAPIVFALARSAILTALYGYGLESVGLLVIGALLVLVRMLLWIFLGAVFLSALLSWVADPITHSLVYSGKYPTLSFGQFVARYHSLAAWICRLSSPSCCCNWPFNR